MGMVQSLSVLALRQVAIGASRALGVIGVDAAVDFLNSRFSDNSRLLTQALQSATTRAWHALEISLAGESLWNKLNDADDRAFRQQLRAFLDNAPLEDLPARDADFRNHCLRELRAARKSGLLSGGGIDSGDLARQAGALAPISDHAGLVEREWQALDNVADLLREGRHTHLARFVAVRPGDGQLPLIAVAVRYFFRRAVETDAELHRGLSFAQWEALADSQRHGFEQLNAALDTQGQRLDEMLDLLGEVHRAVLDLGQEIAGQREQIRHLAQDVMQVLGQHQLERRELRGGDSLSIRNDDERRLVKELVARYRGLPPEQRRQMPALLNAVGKMQVVAGNFDEARQDFQELTRIAPEERGRAEAFFNAYQAALECRQWDVALTAFRQAVPLDSERFALFPLSKYEPERILGAGGFGVAFLCKDRHTGGRVVVKSIRADGLERSVTAVFAEARALEELQDESIIRLRHCDYAGANDTRPYLVMDYFESMTLAEQIGRNGPLPQEEAVALVARVARALQKAHDRGICHRDVKPANILVSSAGVKLIDFGLALRQHAVQTTLGATSSYTQTLIGSSIAGTIDYAAPEQLGKRPGDKVGPRSDVYGLGKTACFALFGTTMPLARHWRSVPADLADLLGQCLAEDPHERPASCREVADRLTGAAPIPVAQAVPAAAPAPETPVLPAPPDPRPHLIVGGVLGGIAGLFAGIQHQWVPVGFVILMLAVVMSLVVGFAATVGRQQQKRPRGPAIPGLGLVAFFLSLPLVYLLLGFLAPYAFFDGLHYSSGIMLLLMGCLLALAWGVGYTWGRIFGQTAAAMCAAALIVVLGLPSQSAAFAFGGMLIGGFAAVLFEAVKPFRNADATLDRLFLALLRPLASHFPGSRTTPPPDRPVAAPVRAPAPTPSSTTTSPVSLAFRLPLLLIACGVVGMVMGINSGAAWFDLMGHDIHGTLFPILVGAGGTAGMFVILLSRVQPLGLNLLWLLGGAAVSYGVAGLAGGIGWAWVSHPAGITASLLVWGAVLGAMTGSRLGHPILGIVAGAGVSMFALGGGWVLGHPDPAGLLGISVGVFAGTLLWRGLSRRCLMVARSATLALFGGVAVMVTLAQPELGWKSRAFEPLNDATRYGTAGVSYSQGGPPNITIAGAGVTMAFSPDGKRLLNEHRNAVLLWDVPSGRLRDTFRVNNGLLTAGFQDEEPRYLTFDNQSYGLSKGPSLVELQGASARLSSFDLNPMNSTLRIVAGAGSGGMVFASSNGTEVNLNLLYSEGGESLKGMLTAPGRITAAAIHGTRILLGFADGTIRLVERAGDIYRLLHETRRGGAAIIRLGFSPSGRFAFAQSSNVANDRDFSYAYSVSRVGPLTVWNAAEWKDFFTVSPGSSLLTCAAFSPDERLLLAGTTQGSVQVWRLDTQEHVRTYKLNYSFFFGVTRGIRDVAVSPDGLDIAVTTMESGRVLLWRMRGD